jgi:hypothetical protein
MHFFITNSGSKCNSYLNKVKLGPSLIPSYHEYALACLDLNSFIAIHFLYWFVNKQKELHEDFDGKIEDDILARIVSLSLELGVIRVPQEGNKHSV